VEALDAKAEGLEIRRKLHAEGCFDGADLALAQSFSDVALALLELERFDDAKVAIGAALSFYVNNDGYMEVGALSDFCTAVHGFALHLRNAGHFVEAAQAMIFAVENGRRLAQSDPDSFATDFAQILCSYSFILSGGHLFEDALKSAEEGLRLVERTSPAKSGIWLNVHLKLSHVQVASLVAMRRFEDAVGSLEATVALAAGLPGDQPGRLHELARDFYDLGMARWELQRYDDALEALVRSVETYCEGASLSPLNAQSIDRSFDAVNDRLATTMSKYSCLSITARLVASLRKLAASHPEEGVSRLVVALNNAAACLHSAGRLAEATEALTESATVLLDALPFTPSLSRLLGPSVHNLEAIIDGNPARMPAVLLTLERAKRALSGSVGSSAE
jgi:tetratricopeptide (TPR) repeat protein